VTGKKKITGASAKQQRRGHPACRAETKFAASEKPMGAIPSAAGAKRTKLQCMKLVNKIVPTAYESKEQAPRWAIGTGRKILQERLSGHTGPWFQKRRWNAKSKKGEQAQLTTNGGFFGGKTKKPTGAATNRRDVLLETDVNNCKRLRISMHGLQTAAAWKQRLRNGHVDKGMAQRAGRTTKSIGRRRGNDQQATGHRKEDRTELTCGRSSLGPAKGNCKKP